MDLNNCKESGESAGEKSDVVASCSFASLGLHPRLCVQLKERLGFQAPTLLQAQAIPVILSGRHALINAATGTGKTVAYLAPVIHQLQRFEPQIRRSDGTFVSVPIITRVPLIALVIVPTHQLCVQVYEILQTMLRRFNWVIPGYIMGGRNHSKEKAKLRKGISILVATPGHLLDHLRNTSSFIHKNLRWIIFDEADSILDLGFGKDIEEILSILGPTQYNSLDKENSSFRGLEVQRQHLLLSATLNEKVNHLAEMSLENPLMLHPDDKMSDKIVNQDEDIEASVDDKLGTSGKLLSSSSEEYKVPSQLLQRYIKDDKMTSKTNAKSAGQKLAEPSYPQPLLKRPLKEAGVDVGKKKQKAAPAAGVDTVDVPSADAVQKEGATTLKLEVTLLEDASLICGGNVSSTRMPDDLICTLSRALTEAVILRERLAGADEQVRAREVELSALKAENEHLVSRAEQAEGEAAILEASRNVLLEDKKKLAADIEELKAQVGAAEEERAKAIPEFLASPAVEAEVMKLLPTLVPKWAKTSEGMDFFLKSLKDLN